MCFLFGSDLMMLFVSKSLNILNGFDLSTIVSNVVTQTLNLMSMAGSDALSDKARQATYITL